MKTFNVIVTCMGLQIEGNHNYPSKDLIISANWRKSPPINYNPTGFTVIQDFIYCLELDHITLNHKSQYKIYNLSETEFNYLSLKLKCL